MPRPTLDDLARTAYQTRNAALAAPEELAEAWHRLPPEERAAYAAVVRGLLFPIARTCLLTLDALEGHAGRLDAVQAARFEGMRDVAKSVLDGLPEMKL